MVDTASGRLKFKTGDRRASTSRRSSKSSSQGLRAEISVPEDSRTVGSVFDTEAKLGVIRIVVVTPGGDPQDGPAPMSVDTTAGLARLGDPVELIRAQDSSEIETIVEDPSIDLVLLDRLAPNDVAELLTAIPSGGPPAIVVVDGASEAHALDAFRAGASDCVHFGAEYENVLPVVLLEHVRRWRGDRQRRVSEQRIRWLEDLYAAIVSEMPMGLVVIDSDGLVVAENPEFGRLFPVRSSEATGTSEFLEARVPVEILHLVSSLGRPGTRPSESGSAPDLVRLDSADSASLAYEVRHQRLDDGGRRLLMISDVTESERLADRLESLRRDNREIIENINSALIVVDLAGRITFSNPSADRILGGHDGDLAGRQIEDWFGSADSTQSTGATETANHPSATNNPIRECLLTGARSRGAEMLLQRGDGHWIPVGVSCSPRLDASGRSQGVVAVFQDLSEIKELELQVRQTEKMASIGQLAAGVAHEVNNPMGFIHANLHQMSEYLTDLDRYLDAAARLQQAALEGDMEVVQAAAADVAAISKEIDLDFVRADFEKALLESGEGAERIRHIVKDLRDFSRPDLPARSPADIIQAIDSTANIVHTMMKHSVVIEKNYRELPKIDAYPMQLKQVFMNLIVNAHQAIEARGDREPGVIRIETEDLGDELVIRISDTGVGISERDLSRIFEPFFTTKPVGAGTGLGLSTSFNIVERHGGRILVESEVGRGTVFEVWLPVLPARADDPSSDPEPGVD